MLRLAPFAFLAVFHAALFFLSSPDAAARTQDDQKKPARVVVYVVDEDDQPIENARVSLSPSKSELEGIKNGIGFVPTQSAKTNEDGVAGLEFAANEARSFTVSARKQGAERPTVELAAIGAGETEEVTVVVRTRNDATYRAQVVDAKTGLPIPGVAVTSNAGTNGYVTISIGGRDQKIDMLRRPLNPAAVSDAKGMIELSAATWRDAKITLHADGYAIRSLDIGGRADADGLEAQAKIELAQECLVQVTLFDSPKDVQIYAEFFELELFEPDLDTNSMRGLDYIRIAGTKPDASDTFIISGLPANTTMSIKARSGRKQLAEQGSIGVGAPGTETQVVLDLSSGGSADVRVLSPDGKPVANAELWYGPIGGTVGQAFKTYETPQGKIKTDALGLARIEDLTAGSYRVSLAPVRSHATLDAPIAAAQVIKIEGDGAAVDVVLQQFKGLTIEGMIVDPDGKPTSTYVNASGGGANGYLSASLQQREVVNGKFVLGPLLPGKYSLMALAGGSDDYAPALRVDANAGDRDVKVTLRGVGRIAGRITDSATGAAVLDSEFVFMDSGRTSWQNVKLEPDGSFLIKSAPVGTHHLLARTTDGRISDLVSVEVKRGELTAAVQVTLKRQGILVLTCEDNSGVPARPINYSIYSGEKRWYVDTMSVGESPRLPIPVGKVRLELGRLGVKQRPIIEFEVKAGDEIKHRGVFDPVGPSID